MKNTIREETQNLIKSWENHSQSYLKNYLILGYQNPKINIQSILVRHFFIRELFKDKYNALMEDELNHALLLNEIFKKHEKDLNKSLTIVADRPSREDDKLVIEEQIGMDKYNLYKEKWNNILSKESVNKKISVLEVACGSANDFRFFNEYGLSNFIDYKGIELCENNVKNCKEMFPNVSFEQGNVLDLKDDNSSFDYVLFFDLLEHLEPEATQKAISEMCRVAKRAVIAGFFNMQDTEKSDIKKLRKYHWNSLSNKQISSSFIKNNFSTNSLSINNYLLEKFDKTNYNINAWIIFANKNKGSGL